MYMCLCVCVCVCVCVRSVQFLCGSHVHFKSEIHDIFNVCVLCVICNMKTCHSEIQLEFLRKRYILLSLRVYRAAEVRISYYQFPYLAAISFYRWLLLPACHQSQYACAIAYNRGRLVRDRRTAERHGPSLCVQRVACSVCAASAVTLVTLVPIGSVLSVPSMLRSVVDRITSHLCAYSSQIKP